MAHPAKPLTRLCQNNPETLGIMCTGFNLIYPCKCQVQDWANLSPCSVKQMNGGCRNKSGKPEWKDTDVSGPCPNGIRKRHHRSLFSCSPG